VVLARAQLLAGLLIQRYLIHLHRGSGAASGRGRHFVQCSVDPLQVVFCLTEDQVRASEVKGTKVEDLLRLDRSFVLDLRATQSPDSAADPGERSMCRTRKRTLTARAVRS
jgi:hypothetical protein